MTYSLEMNRQLGTKWFTFYTRVRPWFACLTTLTVIVDFLQYMNTYFSNWWLLLHFAASITQAVLSIAVAVKSDDAYADFVKFVKGVLLFETISMAYGQGVQQYIQNGLDLGSAVISFIIVLVISYFVWYRLNVKYFEKRLMQAEDNNIVTAPNYTEPAKPVPVKPAVEVTPIITNATASEPTKICFCRKCGEKLIENSIFCRKCGTKIEEISE